MIPARYASSRFPGKPLAPLAGRAMILHACDQARRSGAGLVVVATDDARIGDVVAEAGAAQVVLTRDDHQSGTDRLAEVVERLGLPDKALVVNLQGDEPLMPPDHIRLVAELLAETPDAEMSTLVVPVRDSGEVSSPNVVKAVVDRNGYALYFSRAPIPWYRDGDGRPPGDAPGWYRHMGLYGYRAGFLRCYPGLDRPPMENLEALEQLRALWHGHRIITATVSRDGGPGIDTPDDLQRAERLISGQADE
ncbi:MAG: 3-deoxy-manno-octulosonate cytidylyltransferase [Ectothiorhodospiraceae bacterium]|nr:3-deoxy-manno-octulosonate cytidylyltransferase [Ectothiorhodospiraceae bacterium]